MRKHVILTVLLSILQIAARGQAIVSLDDVDLSVFPKATQAKALRYWFDDDATTLKNVTITGGAQTLDASTLAEGLHTVHYQIVDSNGSLGSTYSSVFMKMDMAPGTLPSRLRYWFDDNASEMQVIDATNGTQSLDVSGLKTGIHSLNYQLIDNDGKAWAPVSRLFVKNFEKAVTGGVNRITEYQYWLNKNSQAMQTVTLSNAANPYQLISLLPMQKEPIRSDFFHFEITNGQPTVYAKNLFNIRFHDAAGYFTDDSRTFVDYSVKQEVGAELLENGKRVTTTRPAENAIKWYKFEANPGDTVSFKTSQAATIQVFSPNCEEVYSASASESVVFGGCHVWQTGIYYVALHNVTGSETDISLDYSHMDKYDVVHQDVSVVGNGGCSTITFDGNGFRDLYAVDLFNAQGDIIQHVDIGHESDATTSVTFDFTDAFIGQYSAVFHFTEEEKELTNLVTVEEAKDIELETTVTYPSTFLRGTSTTYTIKIENKGNMTAYKIPLYVYVSSANNSGISKISIDGLPLKSLYELVDNESIDFESREILKSVSDEIGDMLYFTLFRVLSEETLDSISVRTGYFFVDVPPNSTETITVKVSSSEDVSLYATVSKTHPSFSLIDYNEVRFSTRTLSRTIEDYCCEKEKYECIANLAANALDLASLISGVLASVTQEVPVLGQFLVITTAASEIASCVMSSFNALYPPINGVICSKHGGSGTPWKDGLKGFGHGLSIGGAIMSCGSAYIGKLAREIKDLKDGSSGILKGINSFVHAIMDMCSTGMSVTAIGTDLLQAAIGDANYNCIFGNTQKKPGCPPEPPKGGTSNMRNSCEPNDMLGFIAESGSKAIKDGLTEIWYTIQFENDTVFADAPAHDIYLTDTLDVNLFDLSTYLPTKITIGKKSMELTGERNFIITMDMRPEISAIAQIEGTIDDKTGIVRWHISSLDPMTMEPVKDAMIGVLPPNYDGSGLGEASYDISLKKNLPHGTVIPNRSGNIFDNNETVLTPTYKNIIDRIAPQSHVKEVKMLDDETAEVSISATDELSGPWRYDVYVQYGIGSAWFKAAENVPIDEKANVKVYEGMENNFYVVATDSAYNVENKIPVIEYTLSDVGMQHYAYDFNGDGHVNDVDLAIIVDCIMKGGNNMKLDINNDTKVNAADIVTLIDYILKNSTPPNGVRKAKAEVLRE